MAAYTVAVGERGAHAELQAAAVDSVAFEADINRIEVLNANGAAEIFFTTDGSEPTVGGQNTFRLPAAIGSVEVQPDVSGNTVVKLISAGSPSYSVQIVS